MIYIYIYRLFDYILLYNISKCKTYKHKHRHNHRNKRHI